MPNSSDRILVTGIILVLTLLGLPGGDNSTAPDSTATSQAASGGLATENQPVPAETNAPSPSPSPVAPTPAPATPVDQSKLPPTFGVQFHGTWDIYYNGSSANPNAMFTKHLDALAKAKVKMLRVDIGWSSSQPSTAAPAMSNTYNQRIATVLRESNKRGLKVMATLHQSPEWARPGTGGEDKQFPTNPASITPWATWMAKTFGSQVAAWEVWNEPNLAAFSGVSGLRESAQRYTPLLRETSRGLRAGDADAVVVFGGPAQTDEEFIRYSYEAGAKPYFDVMSVHPYQGNSLVEPDAPDNGGKGRATHLTQVLATMAKHGDANKPVWWTEFGVSNHSNAGIPANEVWRMGLPTQEAAGDYLRQYFELAKNQYPQVKAAFVYTAYKPPSDPQGRQIGYALLNADGTVRPQLTMLEDYLNDFAGQRTPELAATS